LFAFDFLAVPSVPSVQSLVNPPSPAADSLPIVRDTWTSAPPLAAGWRGGGDVVDVGEPGQLILIGGFVIEGQ